MERRRKHPGHSPPQDTCRLVDVYNRQSDLRISLASVRKAVLLFLDEKRVDCSQVSIHLVGKRKISLLHAQFFDDPTPTDCISFPFFESFLGEVVICPKVAWEANEREPYEETTLYIFHALLHLVGYDDREPEKRVEMRREEKKLMKLARHKRCILAPPS